MQKEAIYLSPMLYDLLILRAKQNGFDNPICFNYGGIPVNRCDTMEGYSIQATGNVAKALFNTIFCNLT